MRPSSSSAYQVPRTPDGMPDLNGIWQAMNTAHWDLQGHAASQGKVVALGAAFSVPGGLGVLEAVFVASLGASVAAPQLIAALLAYRALYYLAPLVVAAVMHFTIEAKTRRRRRG